MTGTLTSRSARRADKNKANSNSMMAAFLVGSVLIMCFKQDTYRRGLQRYQARDRLTSIPLVHGGCRKSPSLGFYDSESEKCDFPIPPFSMAYSYRKWRCIPASWRLPSFATPSDVGKQELKLCGFFSVDPDNLDQSSGFFSAGLFSAEAGGDGSDAVGLATAAGAAGVS